MPTYGWTPEGFVAKTREQIRASLRARQAQLVDTSLSASEAGVIAKLNETYIEELLEGWTAAKRVADSLDPKTSRGVAVDRNASLSGATRLNKAKSKVLLRLTLQPQTMVVAGSVVSMAGAAAVRFETLQTASSGDAPTTVDVLAESQTPGRITAEPDSLTNIESPTLGWTAVTNPLSAAPGHDIESDAEYETRRVQTIASQGGSTFDGLLADVRKLDGVVSARVIENYLEVVVDGLPPKSFEVIVRSAGGDDDAIAQSIWSNKPVGIEPVGMELGTAIDDEGNERDVPFTRATEVRINVNYEGEFDDLYVPGSLQAAVIAATSDPTSKFYFDVGTSVDVSGIMATAFNARGIANLTLDIARHPDVPADPNPISPMDTVAIGPREVPYFDHDDSFVGNG